MPELNEVYVNGALLTRHVPRPIEKKLPQCEQGCLGRVTPTRLGFA
jgi:hypothetical protein